jgi:hypothetical protein
MSAAKLFSEIFDEFKKAIIDQERILILRKYDHRRFRDFLAIAFNPAFQFDVEVPQYIPAREPAGLNNTYLDVEVPKLYRFIIGHPKRVTDIKPDRQTKLLQGVLESLHKDEAELLCNLIRKDLKIDFLTAKLVKEAFPDINIQLENE